MADMLGTLPDKLASNARWVVVGGLLTLLLLGAAWVAAGREEAAGQDRQAADQARTASSPASSPPAASPSASLDPAFDEL